MAYLCAICGSRFTYGSSRPPESCECGMEFSKERIPYERERYDALMTWWGQSKGLTRQQAFAFWQESF